MPVRSSRPRHIEDDEQRAVIRWARARLLKAAPDVEPGAVLADYLFAVPNGGRRGKTEAARLVGLGVKAGISDLILAIPRAGYAGLYLEMKRPRDTFRTNREAVKAVSEPQQAWGHRVSRAGYLWRVAYGSAEAKTIIEDYISAPPTALGRPNEDQQVCS